MQNRAIVTQKSEVSKGKYLEFMDWILPVYILISLPLFYIGLNWGILFKVTAIITTLLYLIKFGYPRNNSTKIFTFFLLVVAFSCFQYLYNDRPIVLYFNDASNYIAAMFFFYVGVSDNRPGRTFYKRMMYAITIVFLLGLLCYLTMPSWFLERTIEAINAESNVEYNENSVFSQMRFGAFWGDSYSVSHLAVFCSAIAIFDIAYTQDKTKKIAIISLIVGLVSSVASMHRASVAGSAISILLFIYFKQKKTHQDLRLFKDIHFKRSYNKKHGDNSFKFIIFSGAIIFAGSFWLISNVTEHVDDIMNLFNSRFDDNMSLGKAIKERQATQEVIDSMRFFIFGHGLGAASVGARQYGFPGISDMQYVKMFYENGIIGAFLFISLIIRTLRRGLKNIRYYLTEVSIVAFILVAMLGSNSLSIYYLIVYPFWYAVGKICNNDFYQILKREGNEYNRFLSSTVSSNTTQQ